MFFAFAPSSNTMPIVDRIKNIWRLISQRQPKIQLTPTTYVKFGENVIHFSGDFHINTSGTLYLSAEKHVVIQSGQDEEPGRAGYRHAVWINSKLDDFGRPLMKEDEQYQEGKF